MAALISKAPIPPIADRLFPRPRLKSTHTFVELEVSEAAYEEIAAKLREAGYTHAFVGVDADRLAIDMDGIALVKAQPDKRGVR